VRWAAPIENAGLVTRYTAFANPGPASCTTATARETTCTLGAAAGTSYTVTVVAHTAAGVDSAPSGPSAPVTATPPAVPVIVPDTDANLTTDRGPISAAAPGQQIVLIGTGFAPHSTVTIAIYSAPMLLATIITDFRGEFTHGVTVPADLPVGEHTFVAAGVDAAGDPYAMKLPVAVAPTAGTRREPLAVTGAGTAPLVLTGLLLIVVGAAANRVGAPSGRRSAHPSRRQVIDAAACAEWWAVANRRLASGTQVQAYRRGMTNDDRAWAPEACTLPTVERPLRLAEFEDLFATALRGQQRLSPTALRWRLDPAAEPAARDLTVRESACCSFFSFSFARDGDAVRLDVLVPAAHVDVLDALADRAAAGMTP
jgi:hypothetical protein